MQNKILAGLATIFFSWPVFAESTDAPEPSFKYAHNYYTYTVNPDGSYTSEIDYAITILKEDVLNDSKNTSVTYSTSVEKVDVIEAYTQKANGKRIDAPKSNYQLEVNSGKDKAAPAFSDYTSLTVIFPDVAVGDTVTWHYKITQTEPMFAKQFSTAAAFSKSVVYDDVRIKIDVPDAMSPQYEISQLTEKKSEQVKGRKIFEWTFQNKKPVKEDKLEDAYVYKFGRNPGYMFSTFPSYAAIAEAYGVCAKQRAVVTERIQKLADEITKDKKSPAEQAEALYDWVSSNISFAGNCIGVGSVVPRDTNFVLDNHMGDCKDHATLLEALLAAKKIPSTQALINIGKMYDLPKIAVVSIVNHVLNYIPSLDIYADATAEGVPFGTLPDSEMGKPVLLVDGYKDGMKTPAISHDSNKMVTKLKIKIGEDGSAKGSVEWNGYGRPALLANSKTIVKNFLDFYNDKKKAEEYSKNLLKKLGLESGTIEVHLDAHPKAPDIAKTKTLFDVKGFIHAGTAGAIYINPIFTSSRLYSTISESKKIDELRDDFACGGVAYEEEYVYEFPKNIKILAGPDNLSFSNDIVSYQATYELKNNTLTAKRKFDDLTVGPVCEPKIAKAYKELAEKVMPNIDAQIVYK